jgi:hypothetical protein
MRAINATVFANPAGELWNLSARSGELDRSAIKRRDRRLQRHALRAELASLVEVALTEPRLRIVQEEVEPVPQVNIVKKNNVLRLITVVRKRPFCRPVEVQMAIAA